VHLGADPGQPVGYEGRVAATEDRFPFRFAPAYRWAALPFGITPSSAWVRVDGEMLHARFGPWFVHVPLANVVETQASGPYSFVKTAGPAHLSFADRGVTFATNPERGLCIRFDEPVAVLDPTGWLLRHPALTVTVADVAALATRLAPATA